MLYFIPTPIGTLKDFSYRAVETLERVDIIIAEDKAKAMILLNHFNIKKPLQIHNQGNEKKSTKGIIDQLLKKKLMAYITASGSPLIADPGYDLLKACIKHEIVFECLPGPSALIPALSLSGLPPYPFVFIGFLPLKKRNSKLKFYCQLPYTIIIYESPHRLIKTLIQLKEYFQENRKVSVSKEITKKFEYTYRGTLINCIDYFQEKQPKGEYVICIAGKNK